MDDISVTDIDKLKKGDILIVAAPKSDLSKTSALHSRAFLGGRRLYAVSDRCDLPGVVRI